MKLRLVQSLAVILTFAAGVAVAGPISASEIKRKAQNDQADKRKLREEASFVTDRDPAFLKPPAQTPAGDFDSARNSPTVKLRILPDLIPEYFGEGEQYMACWANWAYVTRAEGDRFFCAASDHLGRGATLNVYEFAAREGTLNRILEVGRLLGWTDDSYTDGKIHGHMGVMPDGLLWGVTHEGVHPTPAWHAAGFRGSWLFSYDLKTREARNWGVPFAGHSLPCSTLDEKRGRYVVATSSGAILTWDCNEKRVRYAGFPPNGWTWWARSLFCDRATGLFWGMDNSAEPYRFMSYDPELNHFMRYDTPVPAHPATGKAAMLRGHTPDPAMDGFVYWATGNGTLFRFKPNGTNAPLAEAVGTTWDQGRDTLQIAMDPTGRYLYYFPKGDAPIVQFDVKTGRKKALCWLQDFYFEKYGYWMGEVYGLEISSDGSFLVVCVNGEFTTRRGGASFGHPALVVIDIPKSERPAR